MLTCALIVWMVQPLESDKVFFRDTYLTESECIKNLNHSTHLCIKIDKRKQLTYKEWKKDSCSLSDHIWTGTEK